MLVPIDTRRFQTEEFVDYCNKSDRRIRSGIRYAFEAMNLPLPECVTRRTSGPAPGKRVAAAFAADVAIHGDRTFTPDGNRRIAGQPRPSPALTSTARPDPEQPTHTLFDEVFGNPPTD